MKIRRPNFYFPKSQKPKFQRTNFYPANFAKVDDFLMRSSQPSREELFYIKEKELLTDVINLSNDSPALALKQEESAIKELGLLYDKIPSETDKPLQKNIELFLDKTIQAKQRPNAKMLVHCNAGVDRTGTYVVFYQLFNKLKTLNEAIDEMIKMGHWPEVHKGLIDNIRLIAKNMRFV